jgi:RNA polymerase sigma factor (sigma-70 family)
MTSKIELMLFILQSPIGKCLNNSKVTTRKINNEVEMTLAFQQGHEKALSFFYHEFYPALAHYSFQLTRSRPVAEDIASEAFVKAWRMHYKLNSYAGIKAYLYKIVHRDSVEAILKEQKRAKIYKELRPETTTDSPFDNMVRSEVYRIIHAALKDLSPGARRVIIMHYFEDKNTGQISRELNLHPSTVKTQKMQGLKALRKVFLKPMSWLLYFCIKIFLGF